LLFEGRVSWLLGKLLEGGPVEGRGTQASTVRKKEGGRGQQGDGFKADSNIVQVGTRGKRLSGHE